MSPEANLFNGGPCCPMYIRSKHWQRIACISLLRVSNSIAKCIVPNKQNKHALLAWECKQCGSPSFPETHVMFFSLSLSRWIYISYIYIYRCIDYAWLCTLYILTYLPQLIRTPYMENLKSAIFLQNSNGESQTQDSESHYMFLWEDTSTRCQISNSQVEYSIMIIKPRECHGFLFCGHNTYLRINHKKHQLGPDLKLSFIPKKCAFHRPVR